MATQAEIDALIKMLDDSMSGGTGHINVKKNGDADIVTEEVTVESGYDCNNGDVACKIPNLPEY